MGNKQIEPKIKAIRVRTWLVTAIETLAITLLLFVVLGWKEFSLIDFIILSVIQVVTHVSYFPDGEAYGQQDAIFITNKTAYNNKATDINKNRETGLLREYCEIDYEERKNRYILNELGAIGITVEEYEFLKNKTKPEVKKLKSVEYNGRIVFLTHARRSRLIRLLFKKLPIKKNSVETIMSAVEMSGYKALQDGSVRYKLLNYTIKFFKVFVWGGFLALVGYSARDGITIATVVRMVMYLSSMTITAVTSFSTGEVGQKTYKNQFYLDLCNFIDEFNGWKSTKNIEKPLH